MLGNLQDAASLKRTSHPIEAWLVDLDGTLYWQAPVRLAMGMELAIFGMRHAPLISRFRKEQESLRAASLPGTCPYQTQVARTAAALGKDEAYVLEIIRQWMERRPGKWLRLFRRRGLIARIERFLGAGGKTALVSDYPAREKLQALGLADMFSTVVACGEPNGPTKLKPSPEGYLCAAQRLGVLPERCLVIGDREDADGEAAMQAGMTFFNISAPAASLPGQPSELALH